MTRSLKDRFLAACEFNKVRALLELPLGVSMHNPDDIGNQLLRQLEHENARLRPLLLAAAEVIALAERGVDGKTYLVVPGDTWHERMTKALARLTAALNEGE